MPTKDHPRLMRQLFDSIVKTTADLKQLEIVLYTDTDDRESALLNDPRLSFTRLCGKNETMGRITQRCFDASCGRYIILGNDDMIFRTKGWDKILLAEFSRSPDDIALLYGNDLYYGKEVATFPILPRMSCELMNKICSEEYRKHCIDPHVLDIFMRLAELGHNRKTYLPQVVFEHMLLGLMLKDPEVSAPDDSADQDTYFALAAQRQQVALRMAEHIDHYNQGTT